MWSHGEKMHTAIEALQLRESAHGGAARARHELQQLLALAAGEGTRQSAGAVRERQPRRDAESTIELWSRGLGSSVASVAAAWTDPLARLLTASSAPLAAGRETLSTGHEQFVQLVGQVDELLKSSHTPQQVAN